jgi:hypothetical protein
MHRWTWVNDNPFFRFADKESTSFGNCRIDADCGNEHYSYCSLASSWECNGLRLLDSYYCHTPKDKCLDDRDCTGNQYCNFDVVEGRWECVAPPRSALTSQPSRGGRFSGDH